MLARVLGVVVMFALAALPSIDAQPWDPLWHFDTHG
jgi:hypothetical protein